MAIDTTIISFDMSGTNIVALAAVTLAILLSARLFAQILHRRLFHPLHSFPGPWMNSVSELPAAVALVKGDQHTYYRSLHEKYGPVVRVSPNELSFISAGAREEIHGFRKGAMLMEKSPIFLGAVGGVNGQTGVSLAINAEHTRQRRALGFVFTSNALLQFQSVIQSHIHKLVAVFQTMADEGQPVDVSSWCKAMSKSFLTVELTIVTDTYLAFDVMGDLCFAEPFGCLSQGSATEWSTSVINVFVAATWTQAIRRLSGVGNWLESLMVRLLVPAKASEWRQIHLNNSREKTMHRLADQDRDHTDFLYHILKNESKKALSQTEVVLNIALFISAGTDTTATALTGWTYLICTHPEAYNRLINEVRAAFATEDDISWQKVKELRFLEATIHEALRLFPPSPASQQRIVPPGGATIDGRYVPAGTTVAIAPWVATHSNVNFHEADEFRPERWLGEDDKFRDDHLGASVPFGTGPRVCVGRNLAYMEMQLIASHLLWNFDLELDRGLYKEKNQVWGLDGQLKPMKVFHSMTKPELRVGLKRIER
ncbi:cytochrome P450 [Xylariaceae sp. FL0016]|nr:cytochrome P450 [Xylariaceae sp. FL0016]